MSSNDKSQHSEREDVLERNVTTLLEAGGEGPRISDIARARIRARLLEEHGRARTPARPRSPLVAVGLGLVATAAAALIVTRVVGDPAPQAPASDTALADGSTWIAAPGGKVTVIGPRRVRVTGAALLDVAPGKGTFVVETASGRIDVLGTRFLVDAQAARTTTAVVRGQVKLATPDGEVLLHAGEQAVAEPGRPPSRGPAPRLSHLVSWAAAARRRDEHAVRPLRNGTLYARDPNNARVPESALPITKLTVDVVVEDQVARVALDQAFHNPATTVREGMYRFAIPPDASLQRLAMYVDGRLTEAGVVERMQARRIYEDIVYRRLDPALLEWAGTGRLALRVYPLPPREDKRLLLAYTQSLSKLYDDWTLTVPLPEVDLPVGTLELGARVRGCANCEITSTSHPIEVQRSGHDAIVSYRGTNVRIGDSLVLRVRDPRKQAVVSTHADGTGAYLLVRARPELGAAARSYRPRTWVIVDDVSASRGRLELDAQADLVDAFLRELDEADRVAVVAFDVEARTKLGITRVDAVERRALRGALKGEGGVGATNFTAALTAATELLAGVAPEDARIVYLGDGVITTGAKNLDALRAQLAGKAQFIGVGVGDGADTQTLEALAAATGGYATTIDLADDVQWRAFDLIAALHTPRVTGIAARLVDAAGPVPATVYVKTPQLADGEELELVAKLAAGAAPAAVVVTGTLDGKPWEQRVALTDPASSAGYLPRLWAQRHVAARLLAKHDAIVLSPCGDPDAGRRAAPATCPTAAELREKRDEEIRREVVALGKRYFLLSRHTSLLVLEDDAMYARYGVAKGSGDTWAPYAAPAKIPVVPWTAASGVPADVSGDAELVRSPLVVFYDHGPLDDGRFRGVGISWISDDLTGQQAIAPVASFAGSLGTRFELGLANRASGPQQNSMPSASLPFSGSAMVEKKRVPAGIGAADDGTSRQEKESRRSLTTSELLSGDVADGGLGGVGWGRSGGRERSDRGMGGGGLSRGGTLHLQRFGDPHDTAYDDLTAFVPALMRDTSDVVRAELAAGATGAKSHPIDDAARDLLRAARRALPTGVYRWGDREIAIDGARRLGWRHTTGADLRETASFDGTTWTRRYAELGLDVTRSLAEDDVALALAYLPLWIADPAHYARWFEVRVRGPREVTLARASTVPGGKAELAYALVFDDAHHLVALRDADGRDLLHVTWTAGAPTAARIDGAAHEVGFTAQPIADALTWAHGDTKPGVVIELPGRLPAYWTARAAKLVVGSPAWRHAQRQLLVGLAAVGDRAALSAGYELLRANGGVELGDLVLASGGITTGASDAAVASALAPLRDEPIARYLGAARAYVRNPGPARMRAETRAGLVGALWTLREVTALLADHRGKQAVDRLLSLGDRAFDLRWIGAAATGRHYDVAPTEVARAWDAVATGDHTNIARVQAALVFANRGAYDAVAERIAKLVADLDLRAAPPTLPQAPWHFQRSRRGAAGWQHAWATWRDRALAGDSLEHVLALLPSAHRPAERAAILSRAAELAHGDPQRVIEVAELARLHGHAAMAEALVEPLVKTRPTRPLHQLAAALAQQQGRPADALAHLEAAQNLASDEAVSLSTVRAELTHILALAREVAVQATGAARDSAVERALTWAGRWRAVDPGNAQIDLRIGELLIAVSRPTDAWRHLSSVIERDPLAGENYAAVAQVFEAQGRVQEAIAYWHEAMITDQTNPTHRLRKAQALSAVGRGEEGDAILADIVDRKWHVRYEGTVYQVRELLQRKR